jgi:hypothetical protein
MDKKTRKGIAKCLAESCDSEGKLARDELQLRRMQIDRDHEKIKNDDVDDDVLDTS